jgi:hypothetical protein
LYDVIGNGYARAVWARRADLVSGRWIERNRQLMGLAAADLGTRLLIV